MIQEKVREKLVTLLGLLGSAFSYMGKCFLARKKKKKNLSQLRSPNRHRITWLIHFMISVEHIYLA